MIIVSFLVLIGPAVMAMKLCDAWGYQQSDRAKDRLMTLIVDSLLILIASYLVSSFLYPGYPLSFSPIYEPQIDLSLFRSSFVWKYAILSCGFGVTLAAVKIAIQKLKRTKS